MNTKQCSACGYPMKFIKGGTSKKPPYRPYSPFWACSNEVCGATENTEPPKVTTQDLSQREDNDSWHGATNLSPKQDSINKPKGKLTDGELDASLNKRAALDKATQIAVANISAGKSQTASEVVIMGRVFLNFLEEWDNDEVISDDLLGE